MNIVDICTGIRGITSDADMRIVVETVRAHMNHLASRKAMQFNIGQRVKWRSKKQGGMLVVGTITSFGPKNVKVLSESGMRWTVHPSFLQPVE